MIRDDWIILQWQHSIPRESGDDPDLPPYLTRTMAYSPRERG